MPQDPTERIKAKIRSNAFKVEDFTYPNPEKPDEPIILSVCTKIRLIGNDKRTTLKALEYRSKLEKVLSSHFKMEEFISELAQWILDWKSEERTIIKTIKDAHLHETKTFLTAKKFYRKGTINEVLGVLRKDLSAERVRNNFFSSKDNEEREDHYIYEIRSVYRKYFQNDKNESKPTTLIQKLTDNQIMFNMAILLAAMDFLPEKKKGKISEIQKALRYYEKMRKRFEILDKDHNHPDEFTPDTPKKNDSTSA